MIIMGYGITLDVEHLNYAVLDRDQTTVSRDYLLNIAGSSRYFTERPPVADYEELDRRMRSGEAQHGHRDPPRLRPRTLAPTGADRSAIGVWIDGAMPPRGETIRGYVQGMHLLWLQERPHRSVAPATRPGSAPTGHPPRSSCATATTPTSRAWWRWCRR